MTRHALRGALGSAALATTFAVAMAAGRATRLDGSETALVWPAAAVAVVWLLIARNGLLQLVACGLIVLETILINRLTGASLPLGAGFALVNLVCALLVARALCWRRREPRLVQPSDLGWLLGAILVGNTVSAVIGGWVLMTYGAPWIESVIAFGTRNGVSVFVGVAAYLSVLEVVRSRTTGGRRAEGGLWHGLEVAAVYGAGAIVYGGVFILNTGNPFAYLAIPISVFVGLRLSALAGIVHTVLFGTVVIVATFTGHGAFVNGDVGIRAVLAQALVGCCLLVTLTIALYRDSRAALVADLDAAHQETRAAAEELRRLALYDTLTGLANRSLLTERLDHALAASHRTALTVGVLFLDLDGFKQVNDRWGHAAGDAALVEVGRRLLALARPSDTVARLGGDEFVVVCPDLRSADELGAIARRHAEALNHPIDLGGGRVVDGATASIGTSTSQLGSDVDSMLSSADHTMYVAKRDRSAAGAVAVIPA